MKTGDPNRKGDWFVTYTGKEFYPLDPRVEDIDIRDIAHSLSLQTRWLGHCKNFYSIASHSLSCAKVAEMSDMNSDVVAWALMHDAAEAYTGDIIRPIKRHLCRPASVEVFNDPIDPQIGLYLEDPDKNGYARIDGFVCVFGAGIEARILRLIAERFNLPWPMPDMVRDIDNRMLVTEARANTNYTSDTHWIHQKPWQSIKPYENDEVLLWQTPETAEKLFLARAKEYLGL